MSSHRLHSHRHRPEGYWTVPEYAEHYGYSIREAYYHITNCKVPYVRIANHPYIKIGDKPVEYKRRPNVIRETRRVTVRGIESQAQEQQQDAPKVQSEDTGSVCSTRIRRAGADPARDSVDAWMFEADCKRTLGLDL